MRRRYLPMNVTNSAIPSADRNGANLTTILFDLDGTLLPMEQEAFMKLYFHELSKRCVPLGYEPKALVDAVWKGTVAMVKNDGTMKNKDRFWQVFASLMGQQAYEQIPIFDDFYTREFHRVKAATQPDPWADRCVKLAKEKGYTVALATNPLFPRQGTLARIGWAGMDPEDFVLITTYEDCSYCKPNPSYYKEVLSALCKKPEECMMIGNDVSEDMVASDMGMDFFLVDTCILNPLNRDVSGVKRGSLQELYTFLQSLPSRQGLAE